MAGDVINAVSQFLGVVEQHEASSGPLPNGEVMKTELVAGLNGLRADTEASEAIEIAYTRTRRELREACVLFNEHLVAFRTTIASELGRNDVEYRRLRAISGKPAEDDLDEVIEDEPDEAATLEGGGPGEAAAE